MEPKPAGNRWPVSAWSFHFSIPVFFLLILLYLVWIAAPAGAQSFEDKLLGGATENEELPWQVTADEISYDQNKDEYVAQGNASVTRADRTLSADFIRFNQNKMEAQARGKVVLTAGEDVLTGDSLTMDMEKETGTIINGGVFIKENHFYLKASRLTKTGEDSYEAEDASLTSCDGDHPDWKITSRKATVELEGYGTATHASLWAGRMPVLYTPYLIFPAKQERQTGLLTPQIGDSDRLGWQIQQPFFWAINDQMDATIYADYMGDRGLKTGVEFRAVPAREVRTAVMIDYLDDDQVDDGSLENAKWGYTDDSANRPNKDRYWFRAKHDQPLPSGFKARMDLDVVSDQDYLRDFYNGYAGFAETTDFFRNFFSRDIDDYTDSTRINRLNVQRSWSLFSLNAEMRWYDNVINRRQSETDNTLQKMPFVEFSGSKQQLLESPFYFDLDSEYVHFYRQDGTRGHRADVHPRLYWPVKLQSYATFEPSVGVRETIYSIDEYDPSVTNKDDFNTRELYDLRLDLSTELFRVFNIDGGAYDRIKHTIFPRVIYNYVPEEDQNDLPYFDSEDRIGRQNRITYSLTNWLTGRDPSGTEEGYSYAQLMRLKIEQSYDINKEKDDDPEPFSPILGEVHFSPCRYLTFKADANWSTYEDRFVNHNTAVDISDPRGDRLVVEHRYSRDSSESVFGSLHVQITRVLAAWGEYERNLKDEKDILTKIGAKYTSQCWSLSLGYADRDDDKSVSFLINLHGLGEFGKEIAAGAGSALGSW